MGVAYFLCRRGNGEPDYALVFGVLSAFFTAAAGNVINDIRDKEIDLINRPDRPIPSSRIAASSAYKVYFFLVLITLLGGFSISKTAGMIVLSTHLLLYIYSAFLKALPLTGNMAVGILTGLAFFYGGVIAGNPGIAVLPSLIAGLINVIREIVKDIQDLKGDENSGLKTLPLVIGVPGSQIIIISLSSLFVLLSAFPFFTGLFNIYYLMIVLLLITPFLIFTLKTLINSPGENALRITSRNLKIIMVIGILAIYAGQ